MIRAAALAAATVLSAFAAPSWRCSDELGGKPQPAVWEALRQAQVNGLAERIFASSRDWVLVFDGHEWSVPDYNRCLGTVIAKYPKVRSDARLAQHVSHVCAGDVGSMVVTGW
jgi:hypothetical protein